VSRALEDYESAFHGAIGAVLEMLTAERQLSDPHSSVIGVTDADCEMDAAAVRLATAAEDLPMDRKPAGWGDPPAVSGVLMVARTRFVKAALRVLSAECADESADADASSEYAEEQLVLAARNLAADVDAHQAARKAGSS
jgi:hypothetical protein